MSTLTIHASFKFRGAGSVGSGGPGIYLGVKDGIFTATFLERNIFWYMGQLVLCKIVKIVAIGCQILRLKCTKFDSGWGSAPGSTGGAYSTPQTS